MTEKIQKMIDAYIQAELDVLEGKTVTIAGRSMTSENLQEIRAGRQEWERRLHASRGGFKPKVVRFL